MEVVVQKSRTEILEDLESFMKRHASPRSDWYVGTAADARKELLTHMV